MSLVASRVTIASLVILTHVVVSAQTEFIIPADRVVNFVTVREQPSGGSTVVGQLKKGEKALLILSVPSWYRIRLADGTEGFVSKSWTQRVTEAAPPSGPIPAPPAGEMSFRVHFLDVGTGDSAIIDMGDREIIIDGGNSPTVLSRYLKQRQIVDGPVELVVVTHGDADHWKGLDRLMNFDGKQPNPPAVQEFWEPGYDRECNPASNSGRQSYLHFIDHFRNLAGTQFRRPLENFHPPAVRANKIEPFTLPSIPSVFFTVLHTAATPTSDNAECSYLINNASIVLRIEIGGSSFLFTGDANGKERAETDATRVGHIERQLLDLEQAFPGTLKTDVLKVPHHGSETASTIPFIQKTNPSFVVISASTTHHLPKTTVADRYEAPDRVILRTDVDKKADTDHIVCVKAPGLALDCNYEAVIIEAHQRRGGRPVAGDQ